MSEAQTESNSETQASLVGFYQRYAKANLDNCDSEPIHFIGSVQAACILLVFDLESLLLKAYSENALCLSGMSGIASSKVLNLKDVLPNVALELEALIGDSQHAHVPLDQYVEIEGKVYQPVYHEHNHCGFLELLPESALDLPTARKKLRELRQACTQIAKAKDMAEALDLAAQAGRAVTGFARVKIYQFQPDWSGKVVGESKAEHMESFLGLVFPASDIPKQARFLMTLVPYRAIAAMDDQVSPIHVCDGSHANEVDLSWSLLRSVSQMHTLYLRNMGVEASFSASLLHKGKLWGLIACHHDQPGMLPYDSWGLMQDLAAALMAKCHQEEVKAEAEMLRKLRHMEEVIAKSMNRNGQLQEAIKQFMPALKDFMEADGFAFVYNTEAFLEGTTPDEAFIFELIEWATQRTDEHGTFHSHELHRLMPAAKAHMETACGVLIEPIQFNRVCYLIWFRGPVTKTVTWAGAADAKKERIEQDGTRTLLPRNSFQAWVQTHEEESLPWTDIQQKAAHEILRNVLDLVASQLSLGVSQKRYEAFSFAAAHDLKAPIRHIRFAVDEIKRLAGPEAASEYIDIAMSSTERLQQLISGISTYLVLDGQRSSLTRVSLQAVVQEVVGQYNMELEALGASVECELPHPVLGSADMLTNLFHNLIGNAIKYHSPERPLAIRIFSQELPAGIGISLVDNGLGIPSDKVTTVFEPFLRLHTHTAIPGSGLGLAICKRIIDIHGGTIRIEPNIPNGTAAHILLQKVELAAHA